MSHTPHNPTPENVNPEGPENALSRTEALAAEIKGLMDASSNAFEASGQRAKDVGQNHLLLHAEIVDRENRKNAFAALKNGAAMLMDEGNITMDAFRQLESNVDRALIAHRGVQESTQSFYTAEGAQMLADGAGSDRESMEARGRQYVEKDGASDAEIPDEFFRGLTKVAELSEKFEDFAKKLRSNELAEDEIQTLVRGIRNVLADIHPGNGSIEGVQALRAAAQDALTAAEAADEARDRVSNGANALRTAGDHLLDAADDLRAHVA